MARHQIAVLALAGGLAAAGVLSADAAGQDESGADQLDRFRAAAENDAPEETVEEPSDPMDRFREASQTARDSAAPESGASSASGTSAAGSTSGAEYNLFCSGEVKRMTGSMVVQRVAFEFRTILDTAASKHRVVNVVSGPIFQSGTTYDAIELANNIVVLSAELTERQHWTLSSMRLDLSTSRLSGEGEVDLTEIRERLNARLSSQTGRSIPEGGLDAYRKVEVSGSCQAV